MRPLPFLASIAFALGCISVGHAAEVPNFINVAVDEHFNESSAIEKWRLGKGLWSVADGVLRGAEKPEDKHAAGLACPLTYHNADIRFRFRFEGGSSAVLLLRNKFGNVCRVIISPSSLTLQKDRPNSPKDTPEKTQILGKVEARLELGVWYAVQASVSGANFKAEVEGQPPLVGSHSAIDVDKTEVEFLASGDAILFDDLVVKVPSVKAPAGDVPSK